MGVVAGVVIVAVGTVIGSKSIHRRSPSARPAIVTGTDVRSLTERADRASARLAEVGRAMGDLRQRLGRLASETIDTRRKASLLASRVEPLERAVARNERAARAFGTFAATLADTGARIVPLMPGAAAGPAMGWVAWDPLRRRLFVYAVGLPGLRVPWFVESADGAVRLPLERLDDGGAWATIEPMVPATCAFAVRIVPPDADRIVLRGSVAVCPGLPPA